MSTGNYQGYSVDKPTSRVMAPPGGRGSNIFGSYEEEKKPVSNGANTNGTNGTNGATTTTNGTNGTAANGTTNNGTTHHQTSPTHHQPSVEAAANKKQQLIGNNLFGVDNSTHANANRKKRTGYNPITGESYDDEPAAPAANVTPQAQPPASSANNTPQAPTETPPVEQKPLHTSISVKQPPGGRSTKLW